MTAQTIIEQLQRFEQDIRYHSPPDEGQAPFVAVPGSLPILLSAPHGAAHRRDDRYKEEDEYTAAFARLLADRTGAHLLYTWAFSESDPNWDQDSPYKDALRRMVYDHAIQFVIDLHGMSNRHAFGIAVGTMHGRSCPEHETLILTTLQQRGYRPTTVAEIQAFGDRQWDQYVLNHRRFTGGLTSHTITRFAHEELRIAAVQIELCASLRIVRRRAEARRSADFVGDPAAIAHAIETFDLVIRRLALSFD